MAGNISDDSEEESKAITACLVETQATLVAFIVMVEEFFEATLIALQTLITQGSEQ